MKRIYLISYIKRKELFISRGDVVNVPFSGFCMGREVSSIDIEFVEDLKLSSREVSFLGRIAIISFKKRKIIGILERIKILDE